MMLHEVREKLSLDAFLYEKKGEKQSLDFFLEDKESIDFRVSDNGDLLYTNGTVFLSRMDALSDDGKEAFLTGFCDNMPSCYNFDSDYGTSYPWCAPWTCWKPSVYIKYGMSPYDMGKNFAERVGQEYEREWKEEQSYRDMVKNMRL